MVVCEVSGILDRCGGRNGVDHIIATEAGDAMVFSSFHVRRGTETTFQVKR